MIDFDAIQSEAKEWCERNFGKNRPLHHPVLGICEEAGELAHATLKAEQGIRGDTAKHHADSLDAVGDIAIFLLDYCNVVGVSFAETVSRTWQEVRQRDWEKNRKDGKR